MSTLEPIQPHERHIAIGGESWGAALGTETAKYITPKVGIFLYGPDHRPIRKQVEAFAFMSGNAEMAMHPLLQIMEVMHETFKSHAKVNKKLKVAADHFQQAIESVKSADKALKPTSP